VRRIGLLGGMSWQSSALYYRLVNELVADRLGGTASARLVLASVDFSEVERMQSAGDWDAAGALLAEEARGLERAGADLVVLCTNTMHRVAGAVESAIAVPFLHLGDVIGAAVAAAGLARVALLGTRFTMEEPFQRERIERSGARVLVPDAADRETVHRIIYSELVLGVIREESRARLVEVVERMVGRGAQGVVLGCTELELLVGEADVAVPVFATTRLHAAAAVDAAVAPAAAPDPDRSEVLGA